MARRNSRLALPPKAKRILALTACGLGHSSPSHCPSQCPRPGDINPLGAPLTIQEAAAIIGCSAWTVRQKYLPLGLPHLRVGRSGKLTFYKKQVVRWLIARQKGDNT
jgi:hypothetical protein